MSTLLLSDLHLPDKPSPLREGFLRFLAGPARTAQRVYLLGDIFEYWIGDDVGLLDYAAEIGALRTLSDHGVALYFMAGNRDFLVGQRFAAATGVQLLRDPTLIDLDGVPTLLAHGDAYCTADRAYLRWRHFSRNRIAQWLFMRLPVARRRAIAGDLRGKSGRDKRYKAEDIMDVTPEAIIAALRDSGTRRLIHGHTHRPANHALTINGEAAERIVLADWHPSRMEYLHAEHGQLRRSLIT